MFNRSEDCMNRARAISGGLESFADTSTDEVFEHNAISEKLKTVFSKAGYEAGYIYTFYKKAVLLFIALVFISLFIKSYLKFFLFLAAPLIFYVHIKKKVFQRIHNFEKDYTALLVSLASGIRSGLDPVAALSQSDNLFQPGSEVSKAVKKFKIQIEKGVTEEDAILSFASDIDHPDIALFRSSFILSRKEGSSIGECLHRLAKVTRQRQSFRRKIRAAVAMQKLSAFGIAGCAIIIGIIQYISNPKAVNMAMNHPAGYKILMTGVALIILGIVWMLNLSKTRV